MLLGSVIIMHGSYCRFMPIFYILDKNVKKHATVMNPEHTILCLVCLLGQCAASQTTMLQQHSRICIRSERLIMPFYLLL